MGGSLGMAAGEAIVRGIETRGREEIALHPVRGLGRRAHAGRHPVADADAAHHGRACRCCARRKLPYIVVLTNPTTGGVTASYAMLGDVQIAEPGALIGFAGAARDRADHPRETAGRIPARRISASDHGMVDMVVHRHELRPTLARLCRLLTKAPAIERAEPRLSPPMRRPSCRSAPDVAAAPPPRER